MRLVELVYYDDEPHLDFIRSQIRKAMTMAGLDVNWKEWDSEDPHCPRYMRGYGKPTVFVKGKDISREAMENTAHCSLIYKDKDGRLVGVPDVEIIRKNLISIV